ncbi:5'-3' exonuclease PLD3-like isoform X2 [Hermetia illucens]|uniref:5'-3' exonuclease PLD3-like isoform X2 n=1 Tax=Hermetia illucens TaxID=343691 RepID=UPI0018CC458D|nr:5'-3' exonuclease PLD3-like isoform X2 [Hermetia illucens]
MKVKLKSNKEKDSVDESKPTVLESGTQGAEDDFDFDQMQMLRTENGNKWNHGTWCKPSCIPITVILTLIVLVVLLPLLEHTNDKLLHTKANGSLYVCTDVCRMQLVESIPEGLDYPDGSPKFPSTYEAWKTLIGLANKSIDIGSFYWTLRGSDVYNHSSAWQGEKIFQQILNSGTQRKLRIRIAQNAPTQQQPNLDTEYLIKRKAAEVRSVNFLKLLGGGVLHTKVWIVDEQHFYIGSANMDWRSLTQVKELGVLATNCTCLAKDIMKIFTVYWTMGKNNSHIPAHWPDELSTKINIVTPLRVRVNGEYDFKIFLSSSPPPMSPRGRTQDEEAIVKTILRAEKFVHISVMDYFPLMIYSPKLQYWPLIDDALRKAAIEHKVSIKLLISWWNHSRPAEDHFLHSLQSLSGSYKGVDIQVRRFIVPSTEDQAKIPFGRVNHNKYMVTDNTAYIGTSNWSGDYFVNTAGIGFVLEDPEYERNGTEETIRTQLASIFERDWNSRYAVDLKDP